ncbi:hypothetical protein PtA15_5A537 [Puccinia triticina]|uniref:Uncharacterized protein n=1 Tax=Puccinia triticina TaxID=208348 RepID=A0ABY7CIL7_9BASI|nr:uncharacterized protein PtA15_5A537 [Puccinia triticina]WAQ84964.1 hypothetical protein PtA15_5A537 [Puccinia triticina]
MKINSESVVLDQVRVFTARVHLVVLEELVKFVYGDPKSVLDVGKTETGVAYYSSRAILTPLNVNFDSINVVCLNWLPGRLILVQAVDQVLSDIAETSAAEPRVP